MYLSLQRDTAGWLSHLPALIGTLAAAFGLVLAPLPAGAEALPMWTVRGAANEVHLLGSIHFLKPGRDALPPAVLAAYADAGALVMELDLDNLDPVAAQATMQRLGVDPRGRTLEILLGPRDYATATARAAEAGFDLTPLAGVEPWLAALMVSQLQLARLGYDASAGVEQQLVILAARDGKEITGLETLDEQLGALDGLPPSVQSAFLLQTLDDAATMDEQVEAIVRAWRSGDSQALATEFLDGLREQPTLYRRLVVDRNRAWVRQLERLLDDRRDYLVVVGTLHLVGPDSVIAMLERGGYRPQQAHD